MAEDLVKVKGMWN